MAGRQQKGFTREEAVTYLADRKLLTKSPSEYTTPYLKRLAGAARKAEQAGREFTREEARGHARAKVEHLEKEGHRLDQYRIEKPAKRELDMQDLANLLKKTKKLPDNLVLVISGLVKDSDPRMHDRPESFQTYSTHQKWSKVNQYVKNNGDIDIVKFAIDATGYEWSSVHSISFAYPEGKGK